MSHYAKGLLVRAIYLSAAERDLLREALCALRSGVGLSEHEPFVSGKARGRYTGRRIDDLHARLQEPPAKGKQ